jgi:hypothetical protein
MMAERSKLTTAGCCDDANVMGDALLPSKKVAQITKEKTHHNIH